MTAKLNMGNRDIKEELLEIIKKRKQNLELFKKGEISSREVMKEYETDVKEINEIIKNTDPGIRKKVIDAYEIVVDESIKDDEVLDKTKKMMSPFLDFYLTGKLNPHIENLIRKKSEKPEYDPVLGQSHKFAKIYDPYFNSKNPDSQYIWNLSMMILGKCFEKLGWTQKTEETASGEVKFRSVDISKLPGMTQEKIKKIRESAEMDEYGAVKKTKKKGTKY